MKLTDSKNASTERRPYQKPELRDYGRIAELTRAVTNQPNMGDGAKAGAAKT